MTERTWCGVDVVGLRPEHHDWLCRALGHVGLPVAGWSGCVNPSHRRGMSITVRAPGRDVRERIKDLLANEVLGYPVEVEVQYG